MSDLLDRSGDDPRRLPPGPEDLAAADLAAAPAVPRGREGLSLWVAGAVLAVVAISLFLWLSAGRRRAQEGDLLAAADAPPVAPAAGSSPLATPLPAAALAGPITNVPAPQFTTNNTVPTPPAPAPAPMVAMAAPSMSTLPAGAPPLSAGPTLEQRRRAPALVVDLGASEPAGPVPVRPGSAPANPALLASGTAAEAQAARSAVSDEERFAERVGARENERARAAPLRGDPGLLVPEGATVRATLETALDSDLPGYARAVVSRDVRSFDGRNVLIPRGSRVIGQYKAATALGASRVFVIWTRLIRPDGASIALASPAADDLGRAGLSGKVDRHFLQRFGGAILLSVLNGAIAAASSLQTNAQVFIGSSGEAQSAAAAALTRDGNRPPTIRTPQGAAVNIFVARDLDFAAVGPAR